MLRLWIVKSREADKMREYSQEFSRGTAVIRSLEGLWIKTSRIACEDSYLSLIEAI